MEEKYLRQSRLLNFTSAPIQTLIAARKWADLKAFDRLGEAYNFVRDEVAFGYNRADSITASEVITDGYGQCIPKQRC